jgi:hypothetical protein
MMEVSLLMAIVSIQDWMETDVKILEQHALLEHVDLENVKVSIVIVIIEKIATG